MRAHGILLLGAVLAAVPARAACGGGERTVRDPGLQRQWVVVRDCAHPERPELLREIAWDGAAGGSRPAVAEAQRRTRTADSSRPPEVRSGMRVEVSGQNEHSQVHLVGTALGAARVGERVAFRVSVDGAVRHGVVRGPATVELIPAWIER